ncbi:38597_t:CDS:2 [Gigaspora margarita]|uniref:38597_t:CDS:1 n=1 Tax=Gigaspora margarita TaxID=4874 RepID=A0ABN7VUF6_GIGMA|nr:38597_t:CDS:2 [Gigaspora margarita]
MLSKHENTSNYQSKEANLIHDYKDNFTNVEPIIIGESEWFYKATFKKCNITTILKPITISQQFSLNDLINEIDQYLNIKFHDSILRIFGLTKPDCWNYDAGKRPNIQQVITRLNKINELMIEEFDLIHIEQNTDQEDQQLSNKVDDRHLVIGKLLQFFISQFNLTIKTTQITKNLNNYFEVNQLDPFLIFNQLAYQDYNFSMIGYFYEHGIGTDIDYHKAFWMYKLSSESDVNIDDSSLVEGG